MSSKFRVAGLRITTGSMSRPASKSYAPRIGEIGCLTSFQARRYVEPNQRLKLIVAFVTRPRMTNVIALEKFRICGRAE
jgi:hypothetical protein